MRHPNNFDVYQIGNADQTPVFWDMTMAMSIDEKGAKSMLVRSTGHLSLIHISFLDDNRVRVLRSDI